MPWMIMTAPCVICGQLFGFAPNKVPSFRGEDGVKRPCCRGCLEAANEMRIAAGMEPFPEPQEGAYEPEEVPF
jgi:hypothetical protein